MNKRPHIPEDITHEEYFNRLLKDRVNYSPIPKIASLNAVIQFKITDKGNGIWNVIVKKGMVEDVTKDIVGHPTCTFTLSSDTFLSIIRREITPQEAFFCKKVDIKGDMALALKMNILVNYM